ncbi:MAG: hypothetical protein PHT04_04890, partial [Eubacteriales bacterium]|nr:hypothetical protein [Eubacteriales bacterium]
MKYYSELLKLGLFTKEDINQLAGNQDTAKSILRSALHNGYIERLRHNYYAVKSLETGQAIPTGLLSVRRLIHQHTFHTTQPLNTTGWPTRYLAPSIF